jgi:hypothetical protein
MTLETIKIALEKSGLQHELYTDPCRSCAGFTTTEIGIKFSDKSPVWDWYELTEYPEPEYENSIFYKNGYSQNTGATYKGTKRMFAAYNRIEKALGFKIR